MIDMIERTLSHFFLSVSSWIGGTWMAKLAAGLAVEFSRISDMRESVLCAVVPSENLCSESLYDLETKYGIDHSSVLSDEQRIARILDRASMDGSGGIDWLEDVIQTAGFPLYVIENVKTVPEETQFGDVQFGNTTQFAIMPSREDPTLVPGVLITSSPNRRGGAATVASSQFGSAQFGSSQFGTKDLTKIYPQPATRTIPLDPSTWSRIFFLSPVEDRTANENEMLLLSEEQIRYLVKLIEQVKYLRNWCIAQVGTDVQRITSDGAIRVLEDGTTIRRI